MMNSISRSLNIITILTKERSKKQIFVNKNYIVLLDMPETITLKMASYMCKPSI